VSKIDYEKLVIGCLLLAENRKELLCDNCLNENLFTDARLRAIFKEIKTGCTDIFLIADKTKISDAFISSLMDGIPKAEISNVPTYIRKLKRHKLNVKLLHHVEKGAKTGHYEHEKIKALYEEIENLEITEKDSLLIDLDKIEPKPISWLWYNKIPLGKISLIVGDPGAGKSLLSLYMASVISRGDDWPDVKNPSINNKGSVIILTAEDSLDDTVRVRADAMNADVRKIKIIEGMIPAGNQSEFFDIQKHIQIIEKSIKEVGDVKMVVFDPITAYLGNIEGNKNTQLRAVLSPLSILADKYKVAIIGVHHLNKDQAKKALYRALGSVAFTATARSVWLVQLDEDDPKYQRRLFAPLKANICKNPTTLAFTIDGPIGKPAVIFEPEPVNTTAEELLLDEEAKERHSAIEEAKNFLLEMLKNGKLPSSEIEEQAKQMNIASATLKRARTKLRIKAYQEDGRWWTELP